MQLEALHQLHPYLKVIAETLQKAGGTPYLVGGAVRDLVIGIPPGELDIEVFGLHPKCLGDALSTRFPVDWVGQSFGVFKCKGLPVDISVPRIERPTGPGHRDFDTRCEPQLSLPDAAARRDFTINSIYLNLESGELQDPFSGLDDLRTGTLRHTSSQFPDDPLRVLRAMQFIARFQLICDPGTLQLCRGIPWKHLPCERLMGEFEKMILQGKDIRSGLRFLRDCGWINAFPELKATIGCAQDPFWHPEGDVWEHTLLSMNAFAHRRSGPREDDLLVGLAVLCHDLGKPATSFRDEGGRIRSPGHDHAGVPVTLRLLERLTRETAILEIVPLLVREHMVLSSLHHAGASDAAIRRLALRVGRVDLLIRVCRADREGRNHPWIPLPFPEADWLEERLKVLAPGNTKPRAIIQGRDLIAMGVAPGPGMGKLLRLTFEAQLEGDFHDHPGGLDFLRKLLIGTSD